MTTTPTCDDCNIEREYSHQAARPNGYALVYECQSCGSTEAFKRTNDDESDFRSRPL
jgi:uncharacterized Zn finger protein